MEIFRLDDHNDPFWLHNTQVYKHEEMSPNLPKEAMLLKNLSYLRNEKYWNHYKKILPWKNVWLFSQQTFFETASVGASWAYRSSFDKHKLGEITDKVISIAILGKRVSTFCACILLHTYWLLISSLVHFYHCQHCCPENAFSLLDNYLHSQAFLLLQEIHKFSQILWWIFILEQWSGEMCFTPQSCWCKDCLCKGMGLRETQL